MEVEIEDFDVELIMANDYQYFSMILDNCYCGNCGDTTTIVNYKSYLDNTNDIILKGKCAKCGEGVRRCIETGADRNSMKIARHIKSVLKISRNKK
ncbi:hypothetical protein [Pedobacter rhizosphaerae]|uniref:Uncharacterized protein n=1 Tax=Pedobacter rhizosphaerae TaxID=390241 RepID=A0A1H9S353_9SPHI|nr:hypothetical protein [Pedobacter rhizosphaerae]SER79427.1 hypothetical protein SAMN04488023_116109 [Pedobacter rhizosphaerae]